MINSTEAVVKLALSFSYNQISARSLTLLTNIVMAWNTIYIQEILKELKEEGYEVKEEDFDHISPAPFEHINRLGKYNFKAAAAADEIKLEDNGLRALRIPKIYK